MTHTGCVHKHTTAHRGSRASNQSNGHAHVQPKRANRRVKQLEPSHVVGEHGSRKVKADRLRCKRTHGRFDSCCSHCFPSPPIVHSGARVECTGFILERDFILGLLYRAHSGENPDLLIIEVEANCTTREVEDDDG